MPRLSAAGSTLHETLEGLQPVVVLGAARSGTKLLRDLLGTSRACRIVPAGANFAWRQGHTYLSHDALPAAACTPQLARKIRRTLLHMATPAPAGAATYLIEKTCHNTLRVPFVERVLPGARYLVLLRDGRDAATSALQQWQAPPPTGYRLRRLGHLRHLGATGAGALLFHTLRDQVHRTAHGTPSLWGPHYPGMANDVRHLPLATVCARQWNTCVDASLSALEALGADRYRVLRYEALVTDPGTLTALCRWLALPDAETVMATYRRRVHAGRVGTWRTLLSAEEQAQVLPTVSPLLERIDARWPG